MLAQYRLAKVEKQENLWRIRQHAGATVLSLSNFQTHVEKRLQVDAHSRPTTNPCAIPIPLTHNAAFLNLLPALINNVKIVPMPPKNARARPAANNLVSLQI